MTEDEFLLRAAKLIVALRRHDENFSPSDCGGDWTSTENHLELQELADFAEKMDGVA